jgi:uncharacterized membrane protein YcgQ (UPF0703/DUF1980 family)
MIQDKWLTVEGTLTLMTTAGNDEKRTNVN